MSPLKREKITALRKESGFTLVEIAIVLVIIGLLLGGILKGQEMITQAKIKNIINDFNGIGAAVYSYQDRYRALPGDDTGGNRWLAGLSPAGDGNGVLKSSEATATKQYKKTLTVTPTNADEVNVFWWHLRLAGFVPGPTAVADAGVVGNPPTNAVNGIVGVQTGAGATTMGFSSNIMCTTNLPDKIAIAVDTQMDDSKSDTGQLRGIKQTGPNPDLKAVVVADDAYAEDGVSQYTICKSL